MFCARTRVHMSFSSFAPYGITGLPSSPGGGKGALQNFSEKRTLGFNTGIEPSTSHGDPDYKYKHAAIDHAHAIIIIPNLSSISRSTFFCRGAKRMRKTRKHSPRARARHAGPRGGGHVSHSVPQVLHRQADPADHRGVRALGPACGVRRL